MQILTVIPRHERRIRLAFDAAVGMGGFTSPGLYVVTNTDGQAPSPATVAAMIVANSPDVVELQLGADLVEGAHYTVAAVGVPDTGASVTAPPSVLPFYFGQSTQPAKLQGGVSALDAALYGIDILYSKGDFVETPDGDLATVSGSRNVREALWRRALSEGLPWSSDYGLKGREFVDGTAGAVGALRGRAQEQMLRDDRVKSVTATLVVSGTQAFLQISPQLVGATPVDPLQVPVTNV